MPKQIQAQQQTVIVKVAAPEKKRRKRRSKRKPKQPTGEDVLRMAQPIAVYTPLAPAPDTGSQFRELLTAVTMLKAKQDAMHSFIPQYVNKPDIVDLVREPAERPIPEPAPTEPVATEAKETETEPVPVMNKGDFDTIVKYMKRIDNTTTNKSYQSKWKSFSGEEQMLLRMRIENSKLSKEKKQKILDHLDSL